jgi:hypothetical protein
MYISSYTLFTEAVQRKKETCHRCKHHVSCHLPPELRGLNIGSMNGLSFHVQRCHLRSFPDSRRGGRKRILNELAVASVYQKTSREGDGYHCQRYSESRIHDGGKMELITRVTTMSAVEDTRESERLTINTEGSIALSYRIRPVNLITDTAGQNTHEQLGLHGRASAKQVHSITWKNLCNSANRSLCLRCGYAT